MKKPHEETWAVHRTSPVKTPAVVNEGGGVVAVVQTSYVMEDGKAVFLHDHATAKASLLAAAPDMARALLALGYLHRQTRGWHTSICHEYSDGSRCDGECLAARAALSKAGVLDAP